MKTTLTVSVVVNVLLLGAVVIQSRHPQVVTNPNPATRAMASQIERQISLAPIVQTDIAPLHWNQLLSTNGYRAFVANLRAAGCPESTVEDIVRGDTGRAYTMMRERLGASATEPGRWSAQAQAQMADYFLGHSARVEESIGTKEVAASLAVPDQNNQASASPEMGNSMLAAFLQNTDFTMPGMTTDQQQEIAGMRQGLLAQISDASQPQNNQAKSSSTSSASTSAGGANDTASSQFGTDNTQTGTDNSQSGTDDKHSPWHEPSPELLQAAEEESIVAGLFGTGAAMQYDQYQSAQGGK